MDQAPKPKAQRYSKQEWEAQKTNIERLYVTENRPLKNVIQTLYAEYGFLARYENPFIITDIVGKGA